MNIKARTSQLQGGLSSLSSQKAKNVAQGKIDALVGGTPAGGMDFDNMSDEQLDAELAKIKGK